MKATSMGVLYAFLDWILKKRKICIKQFLLVSFNWFVFFFL